MNRPRIAVVGTGHLGRIHTRLLRNREDVEFVGIVDPIEAARNAVAQEFQTTACAHHRELDGRLDAAIIATPTQFHFEVARDLLQRGVHVLVEKPITTTVAEADTLIDLAARQHCVLQVGHVERFNPALTAVRPHLGAVQYVEAVRASAYSFRSTDIGVVLDLMIHDLDIALSLAHSDLVDVAASGLTLIGPHEDVAQARLVLSNGCVANLSASRTSCLTQRLVHIYGDQACATLDLAAGTARLMRPTSLLTEGRLDVNRLAPAERNSLKENFLRDVLALEEIVPEKRNAIQDEHSDFLTAIRTGQAPQVTGTDGRRALDAAHQILAYLTQSEQTTPRRDPRRHGAHILRPPHFAVAPTEPRRKAG